MTASLVGLAGVAPTQLARAGPPSNGDEEAGVAGEESRSETTDADGKAGGRPERFRGSSAWGWGARHRQREVAAGTLHLDVENAMTAHAGAVVGLIIPLVMPRYDLTTRGTLFLTTPGGHQELLAVWKLRLSVLGGVDHETNGVRTSIVGGSFGMSACLAPTYDTRGWVVLLCGEYGGGVLDYDMRRPDGTDLAGGTEGVGFGTVGLGVDVEHNFGSLFHVAAARAGTATWVSSRRAWRTAMSSLGHR